MIKIEDLDSVVEAAKEYLTLIKVRNAMASGEVELRTSFQGNTYDIVAIFGMDAVRGVILPALDNYLAGKKADLTSIGIEA